MNAKKSTIAPDPKEQESAMYFDADDMFGEIPNAPLFRTLVLEEDGRHYSPMISLRCMMRIVGGYLTKVLEMNDYVFYAGDVSHYYRDNNYYLPQFSGNLVVLRIDGDDFKSLDESDSAFIVSKLMQDITSFKEQDIPVTYYIEVK